MQHEETPNVNLALSVVSVMVKTYIDLRYLCNFLKSDFVPYCIQLYFLLEILIISSATLKVVV